MTSNKTLKKIWSITTTVIVALVVLVAVFLMGSRLVGFRVFTVISGSMEPEYSVGDLIYVKEVDPNDVKVGDPITFVMNEDLVVATHRVIEIDAENQHFYTKGDANDTPDGSPVHFNNLIGKPVFSIPLLGYVSSWIQNPPGTYIAVAIAVALILIVFLPDFFKKKEDGNDPEANAAQMEINAANEENERLKAEIERLKAEASNYSSDGLDQPDSQKENEESE